jgi:hypothetical protein
VLGLLSVLVILALAFCAGRYLGQATLESQVMIAYEIHNMDQVKGEAVNQPGEIIKKRVRTYKPTKSTALNGVESTGLLRYYQDLNELEQWLGEMKILDSGSNVLAEEVNQGIKSDDCDDYALKLQEKALQDGYMMSFEIIHSREYNELFKKGQVPDGTIHAINSVIIGNEVYYIEPTTQEIVLVAFLD